MFKNILDNMELKNNNNKKKKTVQGFWQEPKFVKFGAFRSKLFSSAYFSFTWLRSYYVYTLETHF